MHGWAPSCTLPLTSVMGGSRHISQRRLLRGRSGQLAWLWLLCAACAPAHTGLEKLQLPLPPWKA